MTCPGMDGLWGDNWWKNCDFLLITNEPIPVQPILNTIDLLLILAFFFIAVVMGAIVARITES